MYCEFRLVDFLLYCILGESLTISLGIRKLTLSRDRKRHEVE